MEDKDEVYNYLPLQVTNSSSLSTANFSNTNSSLQVIPPVPCEPGPAVYNILLPHATDCDSSVVLHLWEQGRHGKIAVRLYVCMFTFVVVLH